MPPTSKTFSLVDFAALACAVLLLGAFLLAPWVNPNVVGVCLILPAGDSVAQQTAAAAPAFALTALIAVAALVSVVVLLGALFVPRFTRAAMIVAAGAGALALVHYVNFFVQNGSGLTGSLGVGFWSGLVAALGLVTQVFIPRPAVESITGAKPLETPKGHAPLGIKLGTIGTLLFLHFPLAVIILYAFTTDDASFTFPPPGLTTHWLGQTCSNADFWKALNLSLSVAAIATGVALVLGTLMASAIYRSKFFGREAITLLVVLPIALPGIVTGIALRSSISLLGIPFTLWTIVIGHATFCIVTVYNNVIARFRRMAHSQMEASMDLGASTFQTFWYVVLPNIATALLAGGMLSFALSFDEVIVTTFTAGQQQTLPIWIFAQLARPRERPVTNVAALFVIATTFIPILLAYYFTRDTQE
jgi:putative spermidine/putrescine transport system permease protein